MLFIKKQHISVWCMVSLSLSAGMRVCACNVCALTHRCALFASLFRCVRVYVIHFKCTLTIRTAINHCGVRTRQQTTHTHAININWNRIRMAVYVCDCASEKIVFVFWIDIKTHTHTPKHADSVIRCYRWRALCTFMNICVQNCFVIIYILKFYLLFE